MTFQNGKMRVVKPPVSWLSEKLQWCESTDKDFVYKAADFYSKFKFKNIVASVGDYVLISNYDSADPDTEEGCDVAQITKLYESHDMDLSDRHRAQVIWYSKPSDLPPKISHPDPDNVWENEIIEDHRPFGNDVSIETFFKKCVVKHVPLAPDGEEYNTDSNQKIPLYICRYRLFNISATKYEIQPVIEADRLRLELCQRLMQTPKSIKKTDNSQKTPRTPTAKKSLNEQLLDTSKTANSEKKNEVHQQLSRLSISGAKKCPKSTKDEQWKVTRTKSTKIVLNRTKLIRTHKTDSDSDSDCLQSIQSSSSDDDFVSCPTKFKVKNEAEMNSSPKKNDTPVKLSCHTPLTPSRRNIVANTPGTPKLKLLTPGLRARMTPVKRRNDSDKAVENKSQLPGREDQLSEILSFITSKLTEGTSGCLYISGVPGTGKTATVRVALDELNEDVRNGDLSPFNSIEINGMQMVEPRQAYVHIYKQLTGKTVASAQACDLLIDRFTKPAPRRTSTVMLVDELDALCTRRQEVIYNMVEWTSHSSARLVVVAIANTMDLPERALAAKVSSRLGHGRIQFPPYTHEQLMRIIEMKLNCAGFLSSDAVQLAARKVSAVSGDARRAIALCTRALELVKQGSTGEGSSLGALRAVEDALKEMAAGVSVRAIRCCSEAEKRLLKAAAAEVESTGVEEINGINVADRAGLWSSLGGHGVAGGGAKALWRRLSDLRLVAVGAWPRVMLYVSPNDVHYATRDL